MGAIWTQLVPSARSRTAADLSKTALGVPMGLPDFVPCRRTYSSPATTYSLIRDRSNSVKAALMVNMAFPMGGRIQLLLVRDEVDPQAAELLQRQYHLLDAAGESVKASDNDHIELAASRIHHQGVKTRAPVCSPAGTVRAHLMNRPTSQGDEVPERLLPDLWILIEGDNVTLPRFVGCRNANVHCYPLHGLPLGESNQGSTETAVGAVPPLGCDEGSLLRPDSPVHP